MNIKILNTSDNPAPRLQTEYSAGFDIAVAEDITIQGASCALIPTGIHIVIPEGYEGQLRLRSSMYKKHLVMPNAPGTIDADYRGEIKVPIRNLAPYESIQFEKGDRVAQLVIQKLPKVSLQEVTVEEFTEFSTSRGSEGFGSTGKN